MKRRGGEAWRESQRPGIAGGTLKPSRRGIARHRALANQQPARMPRRRVSAKASGAARALRCGKIRSAPKTYNPLYASAFWRAPVMKKRAARAARGGESWRVSSSGNARKPSAAARWHRRRTLYKRRRALLKA